MKVKKLPQQQSVYTDRIVASKADGTKTFTDSITNVKKTLQYTIEIGAPTIAGVAGTITLSGSDSSHSLSINTNSSLAPDVTIATITFQQAYAIAPRVVFSPTNRAASKLPYINNQIYISSSSTTQYVIKAGDGGFAGSVTCTFNVIVQI